MRRILFFCFSLLVPLVAMGYKEPVHRRMSERALQQSVSSNDYLAILGLSQRTDILLEYIGGGAAAEDDVYQSFPPFRSLNHFYDPINDAPLSVGCIRVGTRADDWALESSGDNEHALPFARDYFHHYLTDRLPDQREDNLRLLFESVGHMIHLVQDMAQPEHTRNDQHLVSFEGGEIAPSLYERKSGEFLLQNSGFFVGYQPVQLDSYRAFFHTDDGKGLADYANRNFVTQDTNYDSRRVCFPYFAPDILDATERLEEVSERVLDADGNYTTMDVLELIYTSYPQDDYLDGARDTDTYHTVMSALDFETRRYDPTHPVYSLSDASFLTRASLLAPRAVGYSAGFIQRFFRGRIRAEWERNDDGTYNLKITNLSKDKIGSDAVITVLYRPGAEYLGNDADGEDAVLIEYAPISSRADFSGLSENESVKLYGLSVPHLHESDVVTMFETRIAIRATLGEEEDEVIGLVQAPRVFNKLRVEVSSTNPSLVGLVIRDSKNRQYPSDYWRQPKSSIEIDLAPGEIYRAHAWYLGIQEGNFVDVTVRAYLDGRAAESTPVLRIDAWDAIYMGCFPPDSRPLCADLWHKRAGCKITSEGLICKSEEFLPLTTTTSLGN